MEISSWRLECPSMSKNSPVQRNIFVDVLLYVTTAALADYELSTKLINDRTQRARRTDLR